MQPRSAGNEANWNAPGHLGVWVAVGAAHLLVAWAIVSSTTVSRPSPVLESLTTTLIMTNNSARVSDTPPPLVQHVVVLQDVAMPAMSLPVPPMREFAESNVAAVSVAPQMLDREPPDMAPFARQAGLLPGESAVVVLRVEVVPGGRVGQVEIDVSSGSRQIDAAAMAYAKQRVWLAGRSHGIEESTWVRYGVRLAV